MKKLLGLLSLLLAMLVASCGGGGGYAGDQGPTNKLRMTPLLSGVILPVGFYATPVRVSSGVPPYYIGTTAPGVDVRLLDDGTVRVAAAAPGKGTVWIQDSSVSQTQVSFTIEAQVQPLTTSIGTVLTLAAGATQSFTVLGGVPPYTVVSTNQGVVTIASNGNSTYTITAVVGATGSADVLITDATGATTKITVTIGTGPGSAPATGPLAVNPASVTGVSGTSVNVLVSGGAPPYTVLASNPSVASATINGAVISAGLISAGTGSLVVQDSKGVVVTAGVSVTAPPAPPAPTPPTPVFTVLPPSQCVQSGAAGQNRSFTLANGTGPFYATVPTTQSLVSVPSGTFTGSFIATYNGTAVTANTTVPITVKDSLGATSTVNLVVNFPAATCTYP